MVVGAAGDHMVAHGREGLRHGLAVGHHVVDIGAVGRGQRLLRRHRLTGDDVLQGAALHTGEHGAVHLLGKRRAAEDHASARPPQGLVGGGGDDIRQTEGAGMLPRRHQTGDVGHVHHEIRPRLLRGGGKAGKVDGTAVRRRAGNDELGPQRKRHTLHAVVVDKTVAVHVVEMEVVQLAGEVHRRAVGQMSAVGKAHGQHRIAGLQQRHIRCHIGR